MDPSSSPRLQIDDEDIEMNEEPSVDQAPMPDTQEDDVPDGLEEEDLAEETQEDINVDGATEPEEETGKKPKKKGKDKEKRDPPPQLVREPGKSLLPFSRVNKIIKADKVRVSLFCNSQYGSHENM
jgi:hypothetical protein